MRRSTVLSLPRRLEFPGESYGQKSFKDWRQHQTGLPKKNKEMKIITIDALILYNFFSFEVAMRIRKNITAFFQPVPGP